MIFPRSLLLLVSAVCAFAQTPPPAPVQIKPADQAKPGEPSVSMQVGKPAEGTLPAVPPDQVVIRVGDEKITAGEFAQIIETLPENVRGQARGGARRRLAESLVKMKVLAQEARRNKIDQDPLFKIQAQNSLDNLLAVHYINRYLNTTRIPEEELRADYEAHKHDYEVIRARHILVRFKGSRAPAKAGQNELTEEEALAKAQELRKRLLGGTDFAALAKQESDDTGSGARGGDLGEFRHNMVVPEFDAAATTLPIGDISEPVKSQYGYHLIQVQSRTTKPFEEARDEIEKRLRPQYAEKLIAALQAKAGVTVDETYFGPGSSGPPAPPPPAK